MMNILDKIDKINTIMNESGIRKIKALAKQYKEATLYFHEDTDGVTTGIGMIAYLKSYGIKVTSATPINYGGKEYAIPKPKKGTLAVLVDFAHGKPVMKIHTDHHEGQTGFSKDASVNFVTTPSNVEFMSQTLSPRDLFPPEDIKVISTVDSADFAKIGVTPDDVMRATFHVNPDLDVAKNRFAMGLVVNKLLLAYKGKPGFLSKLVMNAKPSLLNMFVVIKKLAKKEGYDPPEAIEKQGRAYVEQQQSKAAIGTPADVKTMAFGAPVLVGTTIAQYGGGFMGKGKKYDRYVPFKIHPSADYYTIVWPMGLIQLSKNPFKKGKNPVHLGNLVMKKIMPKYKSKLDKPVTLDYMKFTFEKEVKKGDMGFVWEDLMALFHKDLKGIKGSDRWENMVHDITNKPYKFMSKKQRNIMKKITISVWDVIMSQSGGHPDITNLSGFNFLGKGYTAIMRDIQVDIVKEMKDKRLSK